MSYCGAGEQDLLCINERQVMVRSKNMYDQEPPNTSLEGVRSDLEKRYDRNRFRALNDASVIPMLCTHCTNSTKYSVSY